MIPLTPGNLGITSGAIAVAFQAQGISFTHGSPPGSPSTRSRRRSASWSGSRASSGSRRTRRRPCGASRSSAPRLRLRRHRRRVQRHRARPSRLILRDSGYGPDRDASRRRPPLPARLRRRRDGERPRRTTSPATTGRSSESWSSRADARRPAAARDRRRGRPARAERGTAHERGRRVRRDGARDPLQHAPAAAARPGADPREEVDGIPAHGPVIVVGLPPERTHRTTAATRSPSSATATTGCSRRASRACPDSSRSPTSRAPRCRRRTRCTRSRRRRGRVGAPARVADRRRAQLDDGGVGARARAARLFALFFPAGAPTALGAALAANLALGWAAGG